jgi:hypothetical protein
MLPRAMVAFVGLSVLAAGGCRLDERAWTKADSWYRPTDGRAVARDGAELPVHEVQEGRIPAACSRLENASWVTLEPDDASDLVGTALTPAAGQQFYLVRAVFLNRGTGGFSAWRANECLYVHHGSLGHFPVPMKRTALVLELDRAPKDVYISCSMAE